MVALAIELVVLVLLFLVLMVMLLVVGLEFLSQQGQFRYRSDCFFFFLTTIYSNICIPFKVLLNIHELELLNLCYVLPFMQREKFREIPYNLAYNSLLINMVWTDVVKLVFRFFMFEIEA